MSDFQVVTSDFVKLNVSNSSNNVISFEKKFDKKLQIAELKVSVIHQYFFFLNNKIFMDRLLFAVKIGDTNGRKFSNDET
jgi:hypothetical protein